ncbi:hypothetical protein ColLi_13890 [Colletotrichum liriopes]|uniref:Uncharacterized protein n=1 Tax=Colletotrichum liriopes TaxID=708192 RepID=A0AA37H366_9PEZI|nr:hypothetical protein ColLi_13890 [Colletotrichum liriopes]
MQLMASLYGDFLAMFEERMDSFQAIPPPEEGCLSKIGHQLLKLIKENDPVLRMMGFPAVMRTINREAERSRPFPIAVSQTLSDLHVLAVCLEETANHYKSVSNWMQYSRVVDSVDEERIGRSRPWLEILDQAIEAMEEGSEYNVYAQKGHSIFWKRLVQQMAGVSKKDDALRAIFDEIQQKMPLDIGQSAAKAAPASSFSGFYEAPDNVTATQYKRAHRKGKKPQATKTVQTSDPPSQRLPSGEATQEDLPRIKPDDPDFWRSLRDGSKGVVVWDDFCQAMTNIGCSMEDNGGSAVRFECRDDKGNRVFLIQYHKPHGRGDERTLSLKQARAWWLKRLQRRITLDLDS